MYRSDEDVMEAAGQQRPAWGTAARTLQLVQTALVSRVDSVNTSELPGTCCLWQHADVASTASIPAVHASTQPCMLLLHGIPSMPFNICCQCCSCSHKGASRPPSLHLQVGQALMQRQLDRPHSITLAACGAGSAYAPAQLGPEGAFPQLCHLQLLAQGLEVLHRR